MRPMLGIRIVVLAAVVAATTLIFVGVASAHVSVVPSSLPKGGFQILSFSVPNEEEDANTVAVEVTIPTKYPIAFVSVKPMTGWTITTEKTTLAKPAKTDDGTVTEAVSKITWTATAGGLEPGQFDLFTVSAGPLPTKPSKLEFKAVQTYSDGTIVRWIEPTVKGTPEPEHPAPTLTLTKAASEHGH
jgi:periplasmic copper chaperone A